MKRLLAAIAVLAVCGVWVAAQESNVEQLTVEVLNTYPHDTSAFTQGLLLHEGSFYESTGLRGQSSLREVVPETGEVLRRVDVRRDPLPDGALDYFAEGLTLIDDRLIQLTWQAGEAFVYDIETFEPIETYTYEGEGWGLCYDERYLYMSDGTPYISVREPDTFELIAKMAVTIDNGLIRSGLLNELECVGDTLYANLWQTDFIARIDKLDGTVTALIDASSLLSEEERAGLQSGAVLNGIAYNPESETFFITGKLWSEMFEVRFVPAES